MWWRSLLVLVFVLFMTALARAQAPSSSFFGGRSNEELRSLASNFRNDVLLRRSAATQLVIALADANDLDAADEAGREFAGNIDPLAINHVRAVRRRGHVHMAAVVALAVVLGVATLSLGRARQSLARTRGSIRRVVPVIAFFLIYAALLGGYLASLYENGNPRPFVLFAACMLPLVLVLRAWSVVGSSCLPARFGRGLGAVAATFAIGFLVVEHVNPSYLASFGL